MSLSFSSSRIGAGSSLPFCLAREAARTAVSVRYLISISKTAKRSTKAHHKVASLTLSSTMRHVDVLLRRSETAEAGQLARSGSSLINIHILTWQDWTGEFRWNLPDIASRNFRITESPDPGRDSRLLISAPSTKVSKCWVAECEAVATGRCRQCCNRATHVLWCLSHQALDSPGQAGAALDLNLA